MTLDSFTYERLGWESPTAASIRTHWLGRQPLKHLSQDSFRPQPFDRLAQALRAMGHEDEATAIAIYKEQLKTDLFPLRGRLITGLLACLMITAALLARGAITVEVLSPGTAALVGWGVALACLLRLYDTGGLTWLGRTSLRLLAEYGREPTRILVVALVFGLGAGLVLGQAAQQGVVVPQTSSGEHLPGGCGPDWTTCEARPFPAFVYSFDTMLPLKLGQADKWSIERQPFRLDIFAVLARDHPRTGALQQGCWRLETIFGWVVGGIVLGLVSGILRKD